MTLSSRARSTRASGLPPVAAMTCAAAAGSIGSGSEADSSRRADSVSSPARGRPGTPASWVATCAVSRPARTSATDSAPSRRATRPRTSSDSGSSRWASSITHSTGSTSPAAPRRPSTPRPTRKRSGGSPSATPAATRSAWRWLSGSCDEVAPQRDRQPLHAGEGDHRLRLEPVHPEQAEPGLVGRRGVEQGGLADARLTGDEQRAAAPVARMPEQGTHPLPLAVPAEKPLSTRHPADSNEMKSGHASAGTDLSASRDDVPACRVHDRRQTTPSGPE